MDCSPPGSSVYGISQARILQWDAMPSSRGSSQPRDQTLQHISPALIGRFFTHWAPWNPLDSCISSNMIKKNSSQECLSCVHLHVTWASQVVLEVKKPIANTRDVRDMGSIPGLGRSHYWCIWAYISCSYLFSIYILFLLLPSLGLINSFYCSILLFVKFLYSSFTLEITTRILIYWNLI